MGATEVGRTIADNVIDIKQIFAQEDSQAGSPGDAGDRKSVV